MTSPAVGAVPERLTAKQRQDRIVSLVSGKVFLDVRRLSYQLAVTPQTIRRDLRHLAQSGKLQRHHGGPAAASSTVDIGCGERQAVHHTAKQAIARIAAARMARPCSSTSGPPRKPSPTPCNRGVTCAG